MFDLRVVVPSSPAMIRAWLIGLTDRLLPIHPDPIAFGQSGIDPQAFITDGTLRSQYVPPEIKEAGGFCVGLEAAIPVGGGHIQPVGSLISFVITPIGQERTEI